MFGADSPAVHGAPLWVDVLGHAAEVPSALPAILSQSSSDIRGVNVSSLGTSNSFGNVQLRAQFCSACGVPFWVHGRRLAIKIASACQPSSVRGDAVGEGTPVLREAARAESFVALVYCVPSALEVP